MMRVHKPKGAKMPKTPGVKTSDVSKLGTKHSTAAILKKFA